MRFYAKVVKKARKKLQKLTEIDKNAHFFAKICIFSHFFARFLEGVAQMIEKRCSAAKIDGSQKFEARISKFETN